MLWKCCAVILSWFLRVPSLHALFSSSKHFVTFQHRARAWWHSENVSSYSWARLLERTQTLQSYFVSTFPPYSPTWLMLLLLQSRRDLMRGIATLGVPGLWQSKLWNTASFAMLWNTTVMWNFDWLEITYLVDGRCKVYLRSEDEITVGHRTFSEHLWHLSEQKSICSAKLSGR